MPQAYVKPGVSVSELVNPNFQPIDANTTDICIIGVGAGFQSKSDVVQLLDSAPATLSADDGIDVSNIVVTDYNNPSTVYAAGGSAVSGDYYISGNTIQRSLATQIRNGEVVLISGSNTAHGPFQELVALNGLSAANETQLVTTAANGSDTILRFCAQRQGRLAVAMGSGSSPSNSDGLWIRTDTNPMTVKVVPGSTSILPASTQIVYLDYIDNTATQRLGVAVTLNGATPVNLPGAQPALTGTQIIGLVARNVNDSTQNENVVRFIETADSAAVATPGSGGDITVVFSGTNYKAFRPDNPSTIPNGTTVLVSYTATPSDYFQPTRCFSLQDVESKYGDGLAGENDPDGLAAGSVKSPVSFAAQLAFLNGAEDVVIQILYNSATVNNVTFNFASVDPSNLSDWTNTLIGLRTIEDINLIVPLVATNDIDNSLNLSIFQAIQNHIDYMIDNQFQYLQALLGEDSTVAGQAGAQTLRDHATALGVRTSSHPEAIALISPAAYSIANPVTGLAMAVGGQYVAAALAGTVAASDMATTLTRHAVGGVIDILDARTENDKNNDAKAGLMVIENRRGIVTVRHGLTVAVNSVTTREFSVVRAKHYMIESVRQTLDDQVIGQIVADSRAVFTVQLLVEGVLTAMVDEGVIVTYTGVTAALSQLDPTEVTVRFDYLPAFPLNYVQITFSINTSSNVITATDTQV